MKGFSIGEAVSYGWKTTLKNFWLFLVILVILLLIAGVAYAIMMVPMFIAVFMDVVDKATLSYFQGVAPAYPVFPDLSYSYPAPGASPYFPEFGFKIMSLNYLFMVAFMALSLWLQAGLARTQLNLYKNGRMDVTDIFAGGKYFLHFVILSCLLMGASYVLAMFFIPFIFLFIGPDGPGFGIIIPFIFLFVVEIYLVLRLQFVYYVIIDKDLKPVETLHAIVATWQITRHQVLKLFGFYWVLLGIQLVGTICLLIGTLFTTPTLLMAHVHVYKQLDDNYRAAFDLAQPPELPTAGGIPEVTG